MQDWDGNRSYLIWNNPRRIATIMCDYATAGDIRRHGRWTHNFCTVQSYTAPSYLLTWKLQSKTVRNKGQKWTKTNVKCTYRLNVQWTYRARTVQGYRASDDDAMDFCCLYYLPRALRLLCHWIHNPCSLISLVTAAWVSTCDFSTDSRCSFIAFAVPSWCSLISLVAAAWAATRGNYSSLSLFLSFIAWAATTVWWRSSRRWTKTDRAYDERTVSVRYRATIQTLLFVGLLAVYENGRRLLAVILSYPGKGDGWLAAANYAELEQNRCFYHDFMRSNGNS
jgi:hypothetical protein